MDKQTQKAGDGSRQLQVLGDIHYHTGITEERAREISLETSKSVSKSFAEEAHRLIEENIHYVTNLVMEQLVLQGDLGRYEHPHFLYMLNQGSTSAAVTESKENLDTIVKLLTSKDFDSSKITNTNIIKATEVVGLIDPSALNAVTLYRGVLLYSPNSGNSLEGLSALNNLYSVLIRGELPKGLEWSDHLESLNIMRRGVPNLSVMRKFEEILISKVPGYFAKGMAANDESQFWIDNPSQLDLRKVVIPHEVLPKRVRIGATNVLALKNYLKSSGLSDTQMEESLDIARESFGFEVIDEEVKAALLLKIEEFPNISKVLKWWNSIEIAVELTGVGETLAKANAKRLDTENILPDLK